MKFEKELTSITITIIYISLIYSRATNYLNFFNVYMFGSYAFYFSYC